MERSRPFAGKEFLTAGEAFDLERRAAVIRTGGRRSCGTALAGAAATVDADGCTLGARPRQDSGITRRSENAGFTARRRNAQD
jgi:hypothetical protein